MKRLAAWLADIFRRELEVLETLWAREFIRRDEQIAKDFKALESSFNAKILDTEKRLSAIVENAASDVRRQAVDAHANTRGDLSERFSNIHNTLSERLKSAFEDLENHISDETAGAASELKAAALQITNHTTNEIDEARAVAADAIKSIHEQVAASVAEAKEFMNTELWKRYETLVKDAAGAARIVDASKIAMAVCDVCHTATRRFAVSRLDGRIICSACVAKGQK